MTHTQTERLKGQPKYVDGSQPLEWDRGANAHLFLGHCGTGALQHTPAPGVRSHLRAEGQKAVVGRLQAIR